VSPTPHVFNIRSLENLLMLSDAAVFVAYSVVPQRRMASVTSLKPAAEQTLFTAKNDSGMGTLPKLTPPAILRPVAPVAAPIDLSKPAPDLSPTATPVLSIAESPMAAPPMPPSTVYTSPSAPVLPSYTPPKPSTPTTRITPSTAAMDYTPAPRHHEPRHHETINARRATYVPVEKFETPRSSSKKFMVPVAALVLVAAIAVPLWFKLRSHQEANPVDVATAVGTPVAASSIGTVINEAAAVVTPPATTVSTPTPVSKVSPNVTAAPVTKEAHVKTIQSALPETKPAEVKAPPKPEPIVLAASSAAPRRSTEDSGAALAVAPQVTVASAANIPVIAVPTNTAVPKLTTPPVRVLTGGTIRSQIQPIYPPNARMMRIEGPVALQAHVTPDGNVDKVKVLSGNPLLASAAVEAVKRWKFDPQKLNGQPVEFEKAVTLNFNLPH